MDIAQLEQKTLEELRRLAREDGVSGFSRLKKQDLVLSLLRNEAEKRGHKLRGGVLEVVDDGVGIPNGFQPPHGLGLVSMRERAEELGGTYHLESAASGGTRIVAALPLLEV